LAGEDPGKSKFGSRGSRKSREMVCRWLSVKHNFFEQNEILRPRRLGPREAWNYDEGTGGIPA